MFNLNIFCRESQLKCYKFGIAPQSCLELGLINYELGKYEESKKWLTRATNDYKDYWSQMIIHIRVKVTRQKICDKEKSQKVKLSSYQLNQEFTDNQ